MLATQLKIFLRSIRNHAFFSSINIAGLAVGMAACWLIAVFYFHETSFDNFLPARDRICAVALDLKTGDEEGRTTNTPPPLGARLAADFPEIEMTARTFDLRSTVVRRKDAAQAPLVFNEENVLAADTNFLELFDFQMIEGAVATALDRSGNLVLTEKMAAKYFGTTPAIGRILEINDRPFTVAGIARDLPANSSVQFGFLVPMVDFPVVEHFSWSWVWLQMDTWARLRQPATGEFLSKLEAKFPAMIMQHAAPVYQRLGQNLEENLRNGDRLDVKLLPLRSLHLDQPQLGSRLKTLGDGEQVRIFGIVAGLILLLAIVNFMNLSTARSMRRAREVGIRKALGSQRGALVGQFLGESFLFAVVGMVLAGGLAAAALPVFNRLTNLEMGFSDLFSPRMLPILVALPLVAGLLGGIYPAFYLSRFQAAEIFKNSKLTGKSGHSGLRSSLVVFQFSVSILLMLGTWVVFRQLEFAQQNSPGLNRDHVFILKNTRHLETPTAKETFRQQIAALPDVVVASHSTFLPSIGSFGDFYEPEQGEQSRQVTKSLTLSSFMTDAQFVPTLGIEILQGRNFQPENTIADSQSVIINEAAARAIGWDSPVGKWMRYPGNENQRFQVVGLIRDFHAGSVRTPIEPIAIFHQSSKTYRTWAQYMVVRLRAGGEAAAIEKIGKMWAAAVPAVPFEFDFLDASFARLYRSERRTAEVLSVFAVLAIFIGCLGLFALAAFTAEQRTKEIGIRKVLGATTSGVSRLLISDFLKLVAVAVLLASPLAWYFMKNWLSDFAYHINMEWWMFASAGAVAVAIAFLTVGFQSVRAALANPVQSLRSE